MKSDNIRYMYILKFSAIIWGVSTIAYFAQFFLLAIVKLYQCGLLRSYINA